MQAAALGALRSTIALGVPSAATMADEADDALADYVEQLGELTFNSKPLINTLTMV